MENERVFTDEELASLSKSRLELAKDAIRRGDQEEAEKMVQAIYDEFMVPHDLYRDWLTDILSEIGRQFGDEKLHEIMLKTVGNYMKPLGDLFKKGFRECVEATAAIWRGHWMLWSDGTRFRVESWRDEDSRSEKGNRVCSEWKQGLDHEWNGCRCRGSLGEM